MGNFNRDDKRSGGFGGGKRFGDRDGGRPAMFRAICSDCGNSCELPFKPTGDRPVFCKDCFDKQGNSGRPSRSGDDRHERHDRPRFEDKQMHSAVCAKCGKDCQVPFRPTSSKPVFCNDCFGKNGNDSGSRRDSGSRDSGEVMEQIKKLNYKLDKLMEILAPKLAVEKSEKLKVKSEVIDVKSEIVADKEIKEKKVKVKKEVAPKKTVAKKKK